MAACSETLQFPLAVPRPAPEQDELWYAVQTRVHRERVVEQRLLERGVVTFLPTITEIRRWSDRKKRVEFPLFSSYLFVRVLPSKVDRLRILCVEGVFQ